MKVTVNVLIRALEKLTYDYPMSDSWEVMIGSEHGREGLVSVRYIADQCKLILQGDMSPDRKDKKEAKDKLI